MFSVFIPDRCQGNESCRREMVRWRLRELPPEREKKICSAMVVYVRAREASRKRKKEGERKKKGKKEEVTWGEERKRGCRPAGGTAPPKP